jgi:hypothetical protein
MLLAALPFTRPFATCPLPLLLKHHAMITLAERLPVLAASVESDTGSGVTLAEGEPKEDQTLAPAVIDPVAASVSLDAASTPIQLLSIQRLVLPLRL